ncbi:hypothetical protein LCGC14_1442400 [marine sediment metagenome]|uniref:Uncharacterized protein n=1 Tax=marine sediment metagenome TaxID=412755 RepID=A0A0F9JL02_9ZZZZ
MKISEVDIKAVMKKIRAKADSDRLDAGMSGQWHDGGASALIREVEMFEDGMNGVVPQTWIEYAKEIRNEADPEWEEFQRLKNKFQGDE